MFAKFKKMFSHFSNVRYVNNNHESQKNMNKKGNKKEQWKEKWKAEKNKKRQKRKPVERIQKNVRALTFGGQAQKQLFLEIDYNTSFVYSQYIWGASKKYNRNIYSLVRTSLPILVIGSFPHLRQSIVSFDRE